MIEYTIYGFALIGFLVIMKLLIIPFIYLTLCSIGYTRFRIQLHEGTWKKVGIKSVLKHVLLVWPLQGFQNGYCKSVQIGSLRWIPPLKIEQSK